MYTVARSGRISFFKEQKGYKSNPELTFRGEPVYDLQGAAVEIASDYTKKKHVLRIKYVKYILLDFMLGLIKVFLTDFQMVVNSCCKPMMIMKCHNGFLLWRPKVNPQLLQKVDPRLYQLHRKKMNQSVDRSLL